MGQRDVGALTVKVQAGCGLAFSPELQFVQEGRISLEGARVHGLPQSKTAHARVVGKCDSDQLGGSCDTRDFHLQAGLSTHKIFPRFPRYDEVALSKVIMGCLLRGWEGK